MNRIWKMMIAMLLILSLSVGLIACAPKPSEKTFKNAQKDAFQDAVDQLLEGYEMTGSGDMAITANMRVTLSENLLTMLRSLTGEQMNWLNDLTIQLDQNSKDKKMEQTLLLGYKGKELVSAKMLSDIAKGDIFVAIPVLTKKYLTAGLNDQLSGAGGAISAPSAMLSGDILKYLPTEEVLEKLLYRYYDIIMNGMTGVTFESGKLVANGVEQECTVYELELTINQIREIAKQFLETLKTDKELKEAIYDFANGMIKDGLVDPGQTADDTYNEFVDAIDEALEDLAIADDKGDTVAINWTTYMTKKSEIIGTKLELMDEESTGTIFAGKAQNGEKIGTEVYVETDGEKVFEIKGELTETKQVQSGTYEIKAEGKSMLFVDVKDLSAKQLEEGYIDGTFKICPSNGLMDEIGLEGFAPGLALASMAIELDVSQTKDQKSTLVVSVLNGDTSYVSVTLETQVKDATAITLPSGSDVTTDAESWLEGMDFDALITQMKNSGLPTSVTDMVSALIDSMMHPEINVFPSIPMF